MIVDSDFLLKIIGTKMERLVGFCSELKIKMRASNKNRLPRRLESLTEHSSLFLHWEEEKRFNKFYWYTCNTKALLFMQFVYQTKGNKKSPAIQENPSSPAPNEPVDAKESSCDACSDVEGSFVLPLWVNIVVLTTRLDHCYSSTPSASLYWTFKKTLWDWNC